MGTGLKRKESEIYPVWRDDSKEKRARTVSPVVAAPLPSPSGGSTQTPVQLKAMSHDIGRSSPLPHLAFGDPELLKRQLQQMALMQHHNEVRPPLAHSAPVWDLPKHRQALDQLQVPGPLVCTSAWE